MAEPDEHPPRVLRFGAFDTGGERLAIIKLDLGAGRLEGSGSIDLRQIVNQALRDFDPNAAKDVVGELLVLLGGAVGPLGLTLRRIADADLVFNAEMDFSSGMVVGRSKTADGAQGLSAAVERGIAESIASISTRFADDLAAKIEVMDAVDAVAAVRAAHSGGQLNFASTDRLADALAAIDVDALEDEAAKAFLPLRLLVATRLRRYPAAASDAGTLLRRWSEHRPELAIEYHNAIAVAHADAGRVETAMSIWQKLVDSAPGPAASQRGQILRNLAFSTPSEDPRALEWIALSADVYLQAGNRREAAITHVHWGDILEQHDAREAVRMLESAASLLDQPGLIGDALRAALLYARGRRLVALGRDDEAVAAAMESAAVRRTLTGVEEELLASLALAEKAMRRLGDPRAEDLAAEAAALLGEVPIARFVLGDKIASLLARWDPALAAELRGALATTDDLAVEIGAQTVLLVGDPDLGAEATLAGLEDLHARALARGACGEQLIPIRLCLANVLGASGAHNRAIAWLERTLADAPLAEGVADMLLAAHRRADSWEAGAAVSRREISLKGESFPRLTALAAFACGAGSVDEALRAALEAKKLAVDEAQRVEADRLFLTALHSGASLAAAEARSVIAPVTTAMFDQVLGDFARNTSTNARMRYWDKPKGAKDHEWIPSPERRAQDDLRLWLEAAFGGRVTVLEEVGTGAGRLDLLVQLAGGAQVILELKMLGFRYASTYAASGSDQILHYLANRGVRLGYLVVFDARLKGNGDALLVPAEGLGMTVREVLIDVRPRIEKGARGAS